MEKKHLEVSCLKSKPCNFVWRGNLIFHMAKGRNGLSKVLTLLLECKHNHQTIRGEGIVALSIYICPNDKHLVCTG